MVRAWRDAMHCFRRCGHRLRGVRTERSELATTNAGARPTRQLAKTEREGGEGEDGVVDANGIDLREFGWKERR